MMPPIHVKDAQLFFLKKPWPNYGQDWDIKAKIFCVFTHLDLLAKYL
jgi:hypothetical protein